ncbi:NAD(P)/FAD-dependent oxidoreductase [Comamonas aquatica]|uniref:NAD(P)/FAD-dependent oxidoreductase n=1 Tax=Comamonas aquatica TaxID=225991 RepID=UPI00244C1FF3|nr:NAD(P)/FAD-dependent oxidoreductase [Comamonas aquatica]MDH0383170.1 NAD(P)/FAD-dependent oxidoreductase [Comamonas aquatica]MDH0431174.1 NAD(P)/FAD-dependent oxidoreductase [Comamonas aquatica]MDH0942167.1 NAD(P)/FAD-dependent oxidoreductase [Comamonas aquatica]
MTSAPACPAPLSTDVAVIGAGPVGMFQVFQLGLQGLRSHLIDALPHLGGQCAELYPDKPIYDIPGIPVCTGAELVQRLRQQMAPFAPTLHLGQQVQTLVQEDDGQWLLGTATGTTLRAKAVVIAAGVGSFVPKAVKVDGIDALVGHSVHYHPADLARLPLRGQQVLVHGGDELAVQAAIDALAQAPASVTLMHRREVFTAPEALLAQLQTHQAAGRIRVLAAQPLALQADGTALQALDVSLPDGSPHSLTVQQWLVFQGISPKLGPVADWGLELVKKQLPVDTGTFVTEAPGVYAVGDINHYSGKRKLIVCGFHEATLAAFSIAEYLTDKPVLLQYTTSSSHLQSLLGVAPSTP